MGLKVISRVRSEGAPDEIREFRGEYRWLSNFWPAKVTLDGEEEYASVEHAYQAAKFEDEDDRAFIAAAPTPGSAKHRAATMKERVRDDWHDVNVTIMAGLVEQKFRDPELARRLLATGDAKLIEGNTWDDTFWGVCDGVGENP